MSGPALTIKERGEGEEGEGGKTWPEIAIEPASL